MSFIKKYWGDLKGNKSMEGISLQTRKETGARGFLLPWVHDEANMQSIEFALRKLQPNVVMELGTFEALGTIRMAEAMSSKVKKAYKWLLTFDVGTAPANSLGTVYGCASTFEEQPIVDWKEITISRVSSEMVNSWRSWKDIMRVRDARLAQSFPGVIIEFIQGLTFDTLPGIMKEMNHWDFCFQDTLHTPVHIKQEWSLFRHKAIKGSIVVFDDIDFRNWEFVEWFDRNEKSWIWKYTKIGHGQLWAEKVR